ncbi:uncharacterized protein LOC111128929 [Crassostrea virginica]
MKCRTCNLDKLSKEFPPVTVNKRCKHPPLVCLQCILFTTDSNCPSLNCEEVIEDENRKWFQAIWDKQFTEYKPTEIADFETDPDKENVLHITILNGDAAEIHFNESWTILKLMTEIKKVMKLDINEQRLLYFGKELTTRLSNSNPATLKDFCVKPNSKIQLVRLLYAIPQNIDKVVFDLNWEYPTETDLLEGTEKRDYLDASCLIFEGEKCVRTIDFVQKNALMQAMLQKYKNKGIKQQEWGVKHSGDRMDDRKRIGHHFIDVSINDIPENVTNLFFVLSAWNAPTISRYPNPSLSFYEKSNPEANLCSTTFTHASDHSAVVMCSLSRSKNGWVVYENGQTSSGNAKDYDPIKMTIQKLIQEGY